MTSIIETEHTREPFDSASRYRALFDAMNDGFCIIEVYFDEQERPYDYRFLEINPAFPRHTGLENALGRSVLEMGLDLEPHWFELYGNVARTGVPLIFENHAAVMHRWFEVHAFRVDEPEARHVALLFKDITERKMADARLREEQERLRRAIAIDTVGVIFFRRDGAITGGNDAFLRMSGYSREELDQGLLRWDTMTPPEWMPISLHAMQELGATGHTTPYEKQYIRKDGSRWWALFAVSRMDEDEGVKFIVDISESRAAQETIRRDERRQAYLVKLSDALRPLAGASEIQGEATRVLGQHLGANRVTYAEVMEGGALLVGEGYLNGVPSFAGRIELDDYDPSLVTKFRAGQSAVVVDTHTDPSITAENRANLDRSQIRAYVGVPLVKDGAFAAVLAVHQARPREWTVDDILLVEETAERTWAALERARAERELSELNATLEERVRDRTAQVELLTSALTLAEQEERQRVSQILHDDLQQRLYSLLVRLQVIRQEAQPVVPDQNVQEIMEQLTHAIRVTRTLVTELNPPVLENEGLAAALQWLAGYVQESYDLTVHVVTKDPCEPASIAVRSLLVQMARELLFNVVKHGETQEAWLLLGCEGEWLRLEIVDRGAGFDPARATRRAAPHRAGYGLNSISQRLKLIGGRMEIAAAPGEGSRISLLVPCMG